MPTPIVRFLLTPHAIHEMRRRAIDDLIVARALMDPQQRIHVRPGRDVVQSIVTMAGKRYLLRVIVDVDRSPAQVVTVYRTSKIAKYWSQEP